MSRSIVYLLADTALCGGVKVALRHAELLRARGHEVTVVSPGPRPEWSTSDVPFVQTPNLDAAHRPPADLTVATFWTTIPPAVAGLDAGAEGAVVHFCQGFEGELTHNTAEHPAILDAYRNRVPGWVVAPHLGRLLRSRFDRPSMVIPQPLESAFEPRPDVEGPRAKAPKILITGPFEVYLKGVPVAIEAVRMLRDRGLDARLVRISQWPQTEEERRLLDAAPLDHHRSHPHTFHHHLAPDAVPAVVRDADLLLAPSWSQEGFGLPVLEAMASGVPVIASDIPATRDFATGAARLVPFDQPRAFADAAQEILGDAAAWRAMRRAGLAVASRFGDQACADALDRGVEWVVSGAWRDEAAEDGR